jgi:hypothetical protein
VRRAPLVALALLVLASAAGTGLAQPAQQCWLTQNPAQVAELLFGRNIGGRLGVSEAAWRRFLDREITPRFPAGFTVIDARGQWRGPSRERIVREPSKMVMIVLPGEASDENRLKEIVAAYRKRFKQESVAVIVRPACVSFQY